MKHALIISLIIFSVFSINSSAQESGSSESYGHTFNLGLGIGGYSGYYGYIGRSLPIVHFNYEFDVSKNFTLAPFISIATHRHDYYWGNGNHPHKYYAYRETIIPIGVKGTYYFDDLLQANSQWDFYLAGSLGVALVRQSWPNDFEGDRDYYRSASPLFLDIHIGTEYHFNSRLGMFLDLSSGVSTIGLAFHGK